MRILLGLAVASAIGFTAGAAQALPQSVTYSSFFPTGNNPDPNLAPKAYSSTDWDGTTQSVTIPQFNTALGTLTSIGLSLYGNVTSTGSVQNTGTTDATIDAYNATVRIRILAPGSSVPANLGTPFLLQVNPTLISLEPQTLAAGNQVNFGPVDSAASGTDTLLSGFAPYEGLGSIVFPLFAGTQTFSDVTGGNLVINQTTAARALVSVTYNYDDGATGVPEPASLALLGMGLFAVGLLRRRRD